MSPHVQDQVQKVKMTQSLKAESEDAFYVVETSVEEVGLSTSFHS